VELDLRTIFAVGAVTCIVLGLMQVLTYVLGRFDRWPLWWGASNTLIGLGIITAALRDFAPDFLTITVANVMMWGGCLLLLMGIRNFAGRRPRLGVYAGALALPAILLTLWIEPEGFSNRVLLMSLLLVACDVAVMHEGWRLFRQERLLSALLLIVVFGLTALLLSARAVQAIVEGVAPGLFHTESKSFHWLALIVIPLVVLRGNVLLLLAAERSRRVLVHQAQHDPLTGALNRNGLTSFMSSLNPKLTRSPVPLSLILLDIDHFKSLNDDHGHAAGDMVLSLLASTAQSLLPAEATLARLGGDEFAIVLPGFRAAEAVLLAERLRLAFSLALTQAGSAASPATLSIGIAEGRNADALETLVQRADAALYRSKRGGRNRVQVQLATIAA
jgi:diguanylate cyclase (GGDEF)-like protein